MVTRSADSAVLITDKTQEPHAYRLPGGAEPAPAEKGRLVVSVKNGYDRPIAYSYRWTGETAWKKKMLAKGERQVHHAPAKPGATDAKLEVLVEGDREPVLLAAKRWVGVGTPPPAHAARYVLSDDP